MQIQLLNIVCTLYPSDVVIAVVILGIGVISLPLAIILFYTMKKKDFVDKGGEQLA